jgi:hypothetical protein
MKSRILAIIGLSLLASSGFIAVVAAEQSNTRPVGNTVPATKGFVHPGALETQAALTG